MKQIVVFLVLFFAFFSSTFPALAASPTPAAPDFMKGQVLSILQEGTKSIGGTENIYQTVKVKILDGAEKGTTITVENGGNFTILPSQKVASGETVILSKLTQQGGSKLYTIADKYRLNTLLISFLIFAFFVILIAGRKGVGSLIGIGVSLVVILFLVVPQILHGTDPLFISIIGALIIMVVTTYLAHGFSQQTTIAVISTFLSLLLTGFCAILFVGFSKLNGLGSEDAYTLQYGMAHINFQGLLLGGVIIGAVGALNDITTTQAATISELYQLNPSIAFSSLVKRGLRIGREHIVSLVNTLVLAYAGASIGIFIFILLSQQQHIQPLWVILNSEIISEEIIRTIAGSLGLIAAIPITTLLAAFFTTYSIKIK